jgi:hypothetical protein
MAAGHTGCPTSKAKRKGEDLKSHGFILFIIVLMNELVSSILMRIM